MAVDVNPFPSTTIGVMDVHLPKHKGKRKVEFVPMQHIYKQNGQSRLKIDLFSNKPPTESSGPAIIEPMSDSSSKETDESMVLCGRCKTQIALTEPKERTPHAPTSCHESLEYMREFHKKYSTNDLYGLPKACQEAFDLALTCPDVEQIIQKTTDPAIKARFQHIRYSTDTTLVNQEDDNQDPMVNFIATEENGEISKDDKLKTALVELFPCSSSVNLQHLKTLYVTTRIEGYPISKVFVDCGATVNIMPISIMKTLHRSNDELIPS
ncbi:short-chain dehydrogenase TIC 32 [Pyrus ussuriensis x Pyrus communis]|uniref:Short-chain dehydrogenase TIC 32 n=1 Tax=Pyrus ussuriensis x Pyrus communis TaxID=2448454 RepID=A0A5N5FU21_9ROSA|nr:short-chain dehydrogenase TIC 32 [Pyrus ussuriensis x Pyrus communis]